MKERFNIPDTVMEAVKTLKNGGFEANLVGGCVRDLVLGRVPKDWDIATNAVPEQISSLFPKTFYENAYGTVTVVNEDIAEYSLRHIEITPYRAEGGYRDSRHPDKVVFTGNIGDDLKRRDFTINAMSFRPIKDIFIDPHGGLKDIKDKIIRTVGNPEERFNEDALRIIRAVRLAAYTTFKIEEKTSQSIKKMAYLLNNISIERVRDEFIKIVMSPNPLYALSVAHDLGVAREIIPELEEGVNVKQNGDHIYPVWEHILKTVQHSADRNWPLEVRLAALFHDIGKPRTREWSKEKNDYTFYGHDMVGAKIAKEIMKRMMFPVKTTESVVTLVRYHMFFTDIERITLSAVRRMVRNVGEELIWDLMKVRACDRIGMGRPKESPYRLRKYESMIEEALRAPTSVKMLKIDGDKIMGVTREKPGIKIGYILHALLEETLDNPELNSSEYLENRAMELSKLPIDKLKKMGESGKERKEEVEEAELTKIRAKYGVK